jgi:hypothetical protein
MNPRFGFRALTSAILLFASTCFSQTRAFHFATRDGLTIRLNPGGASFRISEYWLDWDPKSYKNLHLTRADLESVKDGAGEWDTEYGKVVNAALPFNDCSAHLGEEGWGAQGASFGDLQMRAYISDLSEEELERRISTKGLAAAKAIRTDVAPQATLARDKVLNWTRLVIAYNLFYWDYGGTGHVEFYLNSFHGHTAVLVFMHAGGHEWAIEQILKSFAWH